jgi:hypothetical protein
LDRVCDVLGELNAETFVCEVDCRVPGRVMADHYCPEKELDLFCGNAQGLPIKGFSALECPPVRMERAVSEKRIGLLKSAML